MTSTFFADTNTKIRKINKDGKYRVVNNLGLSLQKRGNSKYFVGQINFPFNKSGRRISIPIGVFEKDILVKEAISKWIEIKSWSKANNKNPKLFGIEEVEYVREKTFKEVANEWLNDVYKNKVKERTFNDRKNKLDQVLQFIGDEKLIVDFQRDKKGRQYCATVLKTLFHPHSPVQLTRVRQLLSWIFDYAEEEEYIAQDQNPLYKKFQWETGSKRRVSNKTFADTITSKSWGLLPEFLQSVNENRSECEVLTHLATKAHLLMCIRTGVIVRLEWKWYDPEEDQWIIPPEVDGLKNKREHLEQGICESHIIPSTPEINQLMEKVRKISGWQKYCFYSLGGKNFDHIGEETINDHFKNIGWGGKQSAHQWRSVITTSVLEKTDFDYGILDRQLGRKGHLNGTRGHYDRSTLLEKRKEVMKWWTQTLVEQGLKI